MFVEDWITLQNGTIVYFTKAERERLERKLVKPVNPFAPMPACWRRFHRATSGPVVKAPKVEAPAPPPAPANVTPMRLKKTKAPETQAPEAPKKPAWMDRSRFAA